MKNKPSQPGYGPLLIAIKERIRRAQYQAFKAVHKELIDLYWDIGRMIVERQNYKGWGSGIVERVARDLQREFPESRGFSTQNLWRMRQFYETYQHMPILSAALRELPWTHNLLIMNKTSTKQEREYYVRASAEHQWSSRELERQLKALACQRSEKIRQKTSLRPSGRKGAVLAHFKNEYVLDLLELKNRHSEKDLRKAVLNNLKDFFLEFGRHFTFAGEEYRLNVGGDDFYVDLLFYHRPILHFCSSTVNGTAPISPR